MEVAFLLFLFFLGAGRISVQKSGGLNSSKLGGAFK